MIKLTAAIWEIVDTMQRAPYPIIVVNADGIPELRGRVLPYNLISDMVNSPNAVLHYHQRAGFWDLTEYGKTVSYTESSKSHIIAANLYVGVGSEGRERKARLDKLFERFGGGSAVIRGLLDGTLDIIKRK